MSAKINIKQFANQNIDDLVNLVHATVKKCYPHCYASEVVDFFLEYHNNQKLLEKAKIGIVILAYIENTLVATGYLVESELGGVYVHPNYQKQGIGKEVVEYLLRIAGEKKLKYVWLDSTPFAVSLYKQFGFIVIEEKVDYVNGNVPLDYYYMRKNLVDLSD